MRLLHISLLLSCISALTVVLCEEKPKPLEAIPADKLNDIKVIGALGVPLGTAVEVVATIISGDELHTKESQGTYLLNISFVSGNELKASQVIRFDCGFSGAQLPNNIVALRDMKNANKIETERIKTQQELEKGYVGRKLKLLVYETGEFRGIPSNLPKDFNFWQDIAFSFHTQLVILKEP